MTDIFKGEVIKGEVVNVDPPVKPSSNPPARRRAKVALIHLRRTPIYWLRLMGRAPRGVANLATSVSRWASDPEGAAQLAVLGENKGYVKIAERHEQRVHGRRRVVTVLTIEAVLALAGVLVLASDELPVAVYPTAFLAALTVLGAFGRAPEQAPLVGPVVTDDSSPRITSELILVALAALGVPALRSSIEQARKDGLESTGVGWPNPIREEGRGWRADIDLPPGVTATEVMEKRDRLASGLRRPLSSVWPEADSEQHAGRLILYVSHQPLAKTKQGAWPLSAKGTVNLFEPFPVGIDPRGTVRYLTLMFASMIAGGVPRIGKTASVRLLALGAGLDPYAELHIFDLKGSPDWMPLEPICHRFRVGSDQEDLEYLVRDVNELSVDMTRRYKTLRSLPRNICPEGKVTPDLARDKRYRLHPIVVFIDECQFGFMSEEFGKELERKIDDLMRRGPAAGIMFILSTQKPDMKSLPTGIRSNAIIRFCLKVMDDHANNMVLGSGAYKAGTNATLFARSERGVGWLVGEGDDPIIVRTYYIDAPEAEKIVARARIMREKAGTLSGHAVGADVETEEVDASTILDHLAAVWPMEDGEPKAKLWWGDAGKLLADRYPQYVGISDDAVRESTGLKGHPSKRNVYDGDNNLQVANRRGPAHEDLMRVLASRNTQPEEQYA